MLISIIKMFDKGFLHWFTQRTSACLLLGGIISASVLDNLFLGFIVFFFILIHFEAGIHTIISDYMHDYRSKLISNVSIDLLIIYLAKTVFIMMIYV
jgi:succinate dehydrogenase hydrophobic anchor subunit